MALESSLWRTLPKELLHLVFARLHVAPICQLRVLSKEWKKDVDCKDSEFNHVFDARIDFNMFALLSWTYSSVTLVPGILFDVQANKWQGYETNTIFEKIMTPDGVDGGLVCCVSKWMCYNNKPGFLTVMNPLTKQKTQLPRLCMRAKKSKTLAIVVRMVKLVVDKKTKEYKVFFVGSHVHGGGDFFAQVYDSHVKEWMIATQGYIIGWDHFDSSDCELLFGCGYCVYNCVDQRLVHSFKAIEFLPGLEVERGCCVLLDDHLFVLHKEASPSSPNLLEDVASTLPKYSISEFHLPEKETPWVKLRVHSCGTCKCFRDTQHGIITSKLWGCNGFLLVYDDGSECAWLYNLSICEWRNLPAFVKPLNLSMMCTISWNATV